MFSATLSAFAVCACGVLVVAVRKAHGLATQTIAYRDEACTEGAELTNTKSFFQIAIDETGATTHEPFNECYASLLGTSSISVCDADTGAVGIDTYVDDQCLETVSEGAVVSGCTAIEGAVCTEPGVACATSTSCVTDEPSTIAGDTFNLVALQHSDENCTDPTGAEEIISQDIFGYDAGCTNFGGASSDSLFECRDDGSSIAQTFTSVDTSCTGDVVSEYVAYIQRTFACLEFEGFFYRPTSCTESAATVGVGATVAPVTFAPTLAGSLSGIPEGETPAPSMQPNPETTSEGMTSLSPTTFTASPTSASRDLMSMAPTTAGSIPDDDAVEAPDTDTSDGGEEEDIPTPAPSAAALEESETSGPTTADEGSGVDDASAAASEFNSICGGVSMAVASCITWTMLVAGSLDW